MTKRCPCCGTPRCEMDTLALESWDLTQDPPLVKPELVFCPECHWEGYTDDLVQGEMPDVPDWHEDCREPY